MIEQHTPSSWSPSVASQYTATMRVPSQFPTTLAELAPAPVPAQQQHHLQPPQQQQQQQMQMQMHQQMQMQRSGGMGPAAAAAAAAVLPNSARQSADSSNSGGFSAFQNYGLHVPFLSQQQQHHQQHQSLYVDAVSSQSPPSSALLASGDLGENSDSASLMEWCRTPSSSVTTLGDQIRPIKAAAAAAAEEDMPFFGAVQQLQQIVSMDGARRHAVRLLPQVDRGFFLADGEWTCYRRNYFQVSCALALAGGAGGASSAGDAECPCVVVDGDGTARTAVRFLVAISARVASARDKGVELVQHTPKRDKGPQMTPQPQPIRSGASTACFERLQFKTATANNGKRRAAQQYYVLAVDLLADCDGGERCVVASAASAPIVVRGRSPGHYADAATTCSSHSLGSAASTKPAFDAHSAQSSQYSLAQSGQYSLAQPGQYSSAQSGLLSAASPAAAMAAAVAAAAASCGFGADDGAPHAAAFPPSHMAPPGFALGAFELHSMLPPPAIGSNAQHPLFLPSSAAAAPPATLAALAAPPYFPQQPAWAADRRHAGGVPLRPRSSASPASGYDSGIDGAAAAAAAAAAGTAPV